MPVKAFIGIDMAFAKGKRLPVVICTWQRDRLMPFPLRALRIQPPRGAGNVASIDDAVVKRFADETAEYIERVCEELDLEAVRIAIDAPSAPRPDDADRRACESAMDAEGISCFATPSAAEFEAIRSKVARHLAEGGPETHIPHANQLWMLPGFALFRRLARLAPCIEVYPQAIARALDAGGIHKGRVGGVAAQLRAASKYTGWPVSRDELHEFRSIACAPLHDSLDAYLSAWVAALEEEGRLPHGSPPDDVIWIPRLSAVVDHELVCPGCGEKIFKRWPWGWDSHAAHSCKGLAAVEPEKRKREFRERFGHLWRGGA